jgi:YfiH family protein
VEKEPYLKFDSRPEQGRAAPIIPEVFAPFPEVRAGISTRLVGVTFSNNNEGRKSEQAPGQLDINREHRLLLSGLQIDMQQLALPHQCHSNKVQRAGSPGSYESCDSLITNKKNLALAIRVADCVPVLLFDTEKKAVAAIHAGWRGSSTEIAKNTLRAMRAEFQTDPKDVLAFIGPAAGVCCYEVGDDVAGLFEDGVLVHREGKIFLDLKKENKNQLLQCGVQQKNIEVNEYCTIKERALFYSYRRDGRGAGRMLAVICTRA